MPKAYPCNARFNDILFGAGSEDRTRTNGVKARCPAVRLSPYEASSVLRSLFCFSRNFWKTIMSNPAKWSFLFLRELEGLTPAPPNAPYPPPVYPSLPKCAVRDQQGREGLSLNSKLN